MTWGIHNAFALLILSSFSYNIFYCCIRLDVWMGNFRGNKYSHKHTSLKPSSQSFWDFSLDELAVYDIPALVDYILLATGRKSLSYIGFSQGSATCFASLSLNPSLNQKIDLFIALAATTVPRGLHHYKGATDVFFSYSFLGLENGLAAALINCSPELIFLFFGRGIFIKFVHFWMNVISPVFMASALDRSLRSLFNWKMKNIEQRQKLAVYQHLYTFTSVKQIVHWFQIIRSQRFQMYDDGITMIGRGHIPPRYRLSKITVPRLVFHGECDTLVNIENTMRDCCQLPGRCPSYSSPLLPTLRTLKASGSSTTVSEGSVQVIRVKHYEHLDFLWGKDVHVEVIDRIKPFFQAKLDSEDR